MQSGQALARFGQIIKAQGGDPQVLDQPERLPTAAMSLPVPAPAAGYVQAIETREIGLAAMALGAGRSRKEDAIDPAVGIVLKKKVGEFAAAGESLATIWANDARKAEEARVRVIQAYTLAREAPPAVPLVRAFVS